MKRFSLMEFLDIRRHDVWTVHGWLHFSWLGISASSFHIFKLREIYERLACSYSGNKTLFLILNMCYEHTTLVWDLQQSYVNVPCEKRLHFRCVSWRAKSSLCRQPFNFPIFHRACVKFVKRFASKINRQVFRKMMRVSQEYKNCDNSDLLRKIHPRLT